MANLKSVGVTAGVPNSGTGTVSTLDGAVAWVAGQGVGLVWTTALSAELNALGIGNAILASADITNGTALDRYMDVSIALAAITTPATAGINISIHLYPLNADGSTYGDGRFASAAAGPPNYPPVASIPLVPSLTTTVQEGTATGIVIPPGTFRMVVCNNAGVALGATGNTVKYRTYS